MKKQDFIFKAKEHHGDEYDYSLLPEEFSTESKITIICSIHGKFEQKAGNHIYGKFNGCPYCGKESRRNKTYKHYIGDIIHGSYGDYEIVERVPTKRVKVRFLSTGTIVEDTIGNALKGTIKDHFKPTIFNVGYIGIRKRNGERLSKNKAYRAWHNMLKRCYDEEFLKTRPTYRGCYVCDKWKCFATFEEWYNKNVVDDFFLDKDVLFKGNKEYCPEKCCFIPNEINCLFTKRQNYRGSLPIGVLYTESKQRYKVSFTRGSKRCYVGCFSTIEDAFAAYKQTKEL